MCSEYLAVRFYDLGMRLGSVLKNVEVEVNSVMFRRITASKCLVIMVDLRLEYNEGYMPIGVHSTPFPSPRSRETIP